MYRIQTAVSVETDLGEIPRFYRAKILDSIQQQLSYQPTQSTRNKKILLNLKPPWEAMPPIWELRVGHYRVFYDVNEHKREVSVRAIRHKSSGKTTEEIL